MTVAALEPTPLLRVLSEHAVDFIAIGGFVLQVYQIGDATFDLDVVVDPDERNMARLARALDELDAIVWMLNPARVIRPTIDLLVAVTGTLLLRTKHGRLDVLKEAGGETFETLAEDALEATVAGCPIRIASLEALLRMKRAAARAKDLKVIPAIEAAIRRGNDEPE